MSAPIPSADRDEAGGTGGGGEVRSSRRRPLVAAAAGLLCLLVAAAGLFAFLRSSGDSGGGDGNGVTEVTFDDAGNATSIPQPPHQGPLMELSVQSGPAGSEVTLQGVNFKTADGYSRVELFWDRVGGLKLGIVDAPRFSTKVKIPADAPEVNEGHFIIAVQRDDKGKVVIEQSAQFYVLRPR